MAKTAIEIAIEKEAKLLTLQQEELDHSDNHLSKVKTSATIKKDMDNILSLLYCEGSKTDSELYKELYQDDKYTFFINIHKALNLLLKEGLVKRDANDYYSITEKGTL